MMKIKDENYFDHDADIGIIGRGYSLEECFANESRGTNIEGELNDVLDAMTFQ